MGGQNLKKAFCLTILEEERMMKKISFWKVILFAALGLMLAACATVKPLAPFNPVDLTPMLTSGDYVLKANNVQVIVDKSGSMGDMYKGEQKLNIARDLASAFGHTVPKADITGSLRLFGKKENMSSVMTELVLGASRLFRGCNGRWTQQDRVQRW